MFTVALHADAPSRDQPDHTFGHVQARATGAGKEGNQAVLNPLGNVIRLPQPLVHATQASMETAQRLSGLQRAVTDRLGSLDRGVRDVLAILPAVAADLERVRATVEP